VGGAAGSAVEQVGGGDVHGGGEAVDVDEGDVSLAAFDAAEVGAVQAAARGEFFLGEVVRCAELADALAEVVLDALGDRPGRGSRPLAGRQRRGLDARQM
jgi:hypothetical protein